MQSNDDTVTGLSQDTDNPVNQSKFQTNTCSAKRGKTCASESRLLFLIRQEIRARFFIPTTKRRNGKTKQMRATLDNQTKHRLTFPFLFPQENGTRNLS